MEIPELPYHLISYRIGIEVTESIVFHTTNGRTGYYICP